MGRGLCGTGDEKPLPTLDDDPELEVWGRGLSDKLGDGANGVMDPEAVLPHMDGEASRGTERLSSMGDTDPCDDRGESRGGVAGNG